MSLIDRTPGGFITVANIVLFGVVALEAWMLTTGSALAMYATLALVVAVAGALCVWMSSLLGPEDHPEEVAPVPAHTEAVRGPFRRVATVGSRRRVRGGAVRVGARHA